MTEMRACVEAVMDAEDYNAEEIANAITTVTDAVEEIDPDVFSPSEEDEEEAEETEEAEFYDDDDDYEDDGLEEELEEEDEYDDEDEDDDY